MLTDAQLLTQLQAGDDASFEVLFHRHYDRVYGILYRLLGNKSDAEDVAQQPVQHVEHDDGARIADMRVVVDGRPADIEAHIPRVERREGLFAAGERIVNRKRH